MKGRAAVALQPLLSLIASALLVDTLVTVSLAGAPPRRAALRSSRPEDHRVASPSASPPPGLPAAHLWAFGPSTTPLEEEALERTLERTVVARARLEVERGVRYDASYVVIPFPNGDVPSDVGACADLVVRSFRAVGVDLQSLVQDDMASHPEEYAGKAGDPNIDHRRVSVLFVYFQRHALSLGDVMAGATDGFHPADVLFFARANGASPTHIAMVSDRVGPRGWPLILQNGGPVATESDAIDRMVRIGHFRLPLPRLGLALPKASR